MCRVPHKYLRTRFSLPQSSSSGSPTSTKTTNHGCKCNKRQLMVAALAQPFVAVGGAPASLRLQRQQTEPPPIGRCTQDVNEMQLQLPYRPNDANSDSSRLYHDNGGGDNCGSSPMPSSQRIAATSTCSSSPMPQTTMRPCSSMAIVTTWPQR